MFTGRLVFAQLMDFLPLHTFRRYVARYASNYPTKTFSHLDQYLCMAFAQLTFRESLRDIEVCLRAHESKLYHLGIRGHVARSNLADANEKRDWRIYRDFANALIVEARRLYADDDFGVDLENTVYALDTTTIDLSLKVFPWAHFRKTKAAVKMHTQIDLRGNIPSFIHVSDGKLHEVNVLDLITPEPGSFTIMDRGFLDFTRLYRLTQAGAFFVIRPKSNTLFHRVYSRPIDKSTGLRSDQTVRLTGKKSVGDYPQYLRCISSYDEENNKFLKFFTNNFELPPLTIAQLYKCRWQVELFFKWIKQHLRIKAFFGTNENAVKTQIWIAISVYVLVAIVKKRLGVEASLYTILQILSLTLFEKIPLDQLLNDKALQNLNQPSSNQLNLFD
ncbi:MAG: IS4 family transposase [Proteobacteria bacterium]|nr:IS4 family transposase [Pseudomonadota bacterium]